MGEGEEDGEGEGEEGEGEGDLIRTEKKMFPTPKFQLKTFVAQFLVKRDEKER